MKKTIKRTILFVASLLLVVGATGAKAEQTLQSKLDSASEVLKDLAGNPKHPFPESILKSAGAIAVIPGMASGRAVEEGLYGQGVMVARAMDGDWSSPFFITIAGGGVIGKDRLKTTDGILVFNNREVIQRLSNGERVTLGEEVSVGPGPLGQDLGLDADVPFKADVFSYRLIRDSDTVTEGSVLIGTDLNDAVLIVDHSANKDLHGAEFTDLAGIFKREKVPAVGCSFLEILAKYGGGEHPCG